MHKHNKYKKQFNITLPKVNNPTVIDTKESEEEESPDKEI
jgi:hypothetical protein